MFMNLFKKNTTSKIKAVYEDDLVGYLKSIGVYDDMQAGNLLCKFCGNKITNENLEVIVPSDTGVEIVCNNKNCLNQL